MFKGEFTVPSYYKNFMCKGCNCRKCCCGGWAVTVSMKEYFNLLSLDCSKELKSKIDIALHILSDATYDRYAQITPSYTGECPLRLENGYCGLQCECGEDSIPSVCRYYPREPRLYPQEECCISNSCEWVIEELIERPNITFEKQNLEFFFDDNEPIGLKREELNIRKECMDIVLNPYIPTIDAIYDVVNKFNVPKIDRDNLSAFSKALVYEFKDYDSIREYCENSQEFNFKTNLDILYKRYPKFDIWSTGILANHLFYMKFPYVDYDNNLTKEAGVALIGCFCLWVTLLANNAKTKNDFVDVTSELFRVVEHTRFYKNCMIISKRI